MKWWIVDTGVKSASLNIALDSLLLKAREKGEIPNTLRFLQFFPEAVLVGYHQTIKQEVRVEFCKQQKIDINRRLTGGGAIFFDRSQLGWELIALKDYLGFRLDRITKLVCEAAANGIRKLGIDANFRPRNDIEVNGRKISGTGGIVEDNVVLFQGTLLVDFDVETMIKALRIPTEKLADKEINSCRERVTCLREELGRVPAIKEIKQALQEGFEESLGIEFTNVSLSKDASFLFWLEEELRQENRFKSKDWIEGSREPIGNKQTLKGFYRASGGEIKVSLVVDVSRRMLKQALITGDFFISPRRTIFDLEAFLKDVPVREVSQRIEQFFKLTLTQMPGIKPKDFIAAFLSALEKIDYASLGILLRDVNHLFLINGKLIDVLKSPSVLLLPYCAKLVGCFYRDEEGCIKCGKCSVGLAYKMAEEQGLTPITIHNYRHLQTSLSKFKKEGIKSYIGCCCEAFFIKHERLFREAGIAGVLIDIENETCYDLNKEGEALGGKFENQTNLRLKLLKKVLKLCK